MDSFKKMVLFSDIDLLRLITLGEEQALATLYDRYRAVLFGLLIRILHNRGEAEDVLQEVFVQVWQRAANFDETRGKPFTWLVTITRTRAIDRLRSVRSHSRAVEKAAVETLLTVPNASQFSSRFEDSAVVRQALAELPETERKTLLLAYFDGLTQREISDKTKTPLGTVKSRIRTGMQKLRESLSSLEPKKSKMISAAKFIDTSAGQINQRNNSLAILNGFGQSEPSNPQIH